MILRRTPPSTPPPPAPQHWWQPRLDNAAELLIGHGSDAQRQQNRQLLDQVSRTLTEASDDRTSLAASLQRLDPDRISSELKAALRARPDPTAPDSDMIRSLRERHELQHRLIDRLEALDARIEKTLIDVDTLAARSVELAFASSTRSGPDDDLRRLNDDLAALTRAHEELADL